MSSNSCSRSSSKSDSNDRSPIILPTKRQKRYLLKLLEFSFKNWVNIDHRLRLFIERFYHKKLTLYEENSNASNLGVLASSDNEAKILLTFLRIYTDNDWNYIDHLIEFYKDDLYINHRYLISYMNKYQKAYDAILHQDFDHVVWYLTDEPIEINPRNNIQFKAWTFKELRHAFKSLETD